MSSPTMVKTAATFPDDAKNPFTGSIFRTASVAVGGAVGVTVTVMTSPPVTVVTWTDGTGVQVDEAEEEETGELGVLVGNVVETTGDREYDVDWAVEEGGGVYVSIVGDWV